MREGAKLATATVRVPGRERTSLTEAIEELQWRGSPAGTACFDRLFVRRQRVLALRSKLFPSVESLFMEEVRAALPRRDLFAVKQSGLSWRNGVFHIQARLDARGLIAEFVSSSVRARGVRTEAAN